jgi:LmbE family N-acetylglucosaminyl deacetylase
MPDDHLDVITVGAHPDDLEIICGGTIARLVRQGHRVGMIDLTDGEPTPLSSGPEERLAEAQAAAKILGATVRVTLDLPNRRLFDCFEARLALAKQFRKYRPRLVIGMGGRTPMASPDHYQASLIIEAAVFYSRLTKWDQHFDGLPPHTIKRFLCPLLAFGNFAPTDANGLVVDIGDTLETKMAAIDCYKSQFPPEKARSLARIRTLAVQRGQAAGFDAGEVMLNPTAWGTKDLMALLFGPQVRE